MCDFTTERVIFYYCNSIILYIIPIYFSLCAKDKSKLKDIGVTHIVNCAKGTNFNQVNTDGTYYRDIGVTFLGIKAKDIATYDMTPNFNTAADFIDKAVLAGGRFQH